MEEDGAWAIAPSPRQMDGPFLETDVSDRLAQALSRALDTAREEAGCGAV
jgi:hypothetical protein